MQSNLYSTTIGFGAGTVEKTDIRVGKGATLNEDSQMLSHKPKGDANFSAASFTDRDAFPGGLGDTARARG